MKLYNTLTKKKEEFVPVEGNKVRMYVCGPTVYDYIHIGNARPYIVFDTVRRYLQYKGYDVTYVQNFTDVDDKIIKRANEEHTDMSKISQRYIDEALKDARGLNVKTPDFAPQVTNEMDSIIDMIQTLVDKGFAYVSDKDGSVYYSTRTFKGYGKLSGKNIDELEAGARIKIDENKRDPMDFILWKPKKEGEPAWKSPWGEGRPGWHIECSVMAKKYLGDTIDIHAGGEDLIFPHHENEIAQSEAANGRLFSKYWLHNGFINIDNEKMSKSKGNFFTLREISEKVPYDVIRFFILSAHYRSPVNFSRELVEAAGNGLERIKNCVKSLEFNYEKAVEGISDKEKEILSRLSDFRLRFENAMDDDFNTADAIAAIFELVKFANINTDENSHKEFIGKILNELKQLCNILGFELRNDDNEDSGDALIQELVNKRTEARRNKDWKTADEIRDKLSAMGIVLEDTPNGIRFYRK